MLNFLIRELETKERSMLVGATLTDKCKHLLIMRYFQVWLYLIKALIQTIKKEKRTCVFCGLFNHKCLNVTNPSTGKEICKKSKNCFVCLDIRHNGNSCTRKDYTCKNSHGKHNISICIFSINPLQS